MLKELRGKLIKQRTKENSYQYLFSKFEEKYWHLSKRRKQNVFSDYWKRRNNKKNQHINIDLRLKAKTKTKTHITAQYNTNPTECRVMKYEFTCISECAFMWTFERVTIKLVIYCRRYGWIWEKNIPKFNLKLLNKIPFAIWSSIDSHFKFTERESQRIEIE